MKLRILALASVALVAAACSSSKKSSSTPPAAHNVAYTGPMGAVPISTKAQAAATASGAYTSVGQVTSVGDFTSMPGVGAAPTFNVLDAARAAVRVAPRLTAGGDTVSGATVSRTDHCDVSGTIGGTITVQDPNTPFRYTGDTGSITFSMCDMGGGEVMDGSISITINASNSVDFLNGSASGLTDGYAYAATLAFADLTYANTNGMWFGMEGNITLGVKKTLASNQIEHSVSGTGLAYVVGQGSSILAGSLLTGPNGNDQYLQKAVTVYTNSSFYTESYDLDTINGRVCSIAMGGCVSVVTVTPVHDDAGASHPSSGKFVITSGNAEIIFDIKSVTSVDVGYDFNTADNAGTDPTPLTTAHVTWTCLDANTCVF